MKKFLALLLMMMILASAQAKVFGKLEIAGLDQTWRGQYLPGLGTVELCKEGHWTGNDPTMRVFIDDMDIDDSILAAKALLGTAGSDTDFTLQAGSFTLRGYRETVNNVVIDKLFYSIDSRRTLRFNLFVQKKAIKGMERDDPEILAIIEGTIRANGFDAVPEAPETEIAPEDRHSLATGGAAGLEMAEAAGFSAPVPAGWSVQESSMDTQLLLIRGDGEYGCAPSVQIVFSDSKDVKTRRAEVMRYSDEYRDIEVLIDGEPVCALETTMRMASKPVYWTYASLFLPAEPSGCISISVSVDSSEFAGCALEDPDVQAIITGIQRP